jgi:probable addiction module antidote protein
MRETQNSLNAAFKTGDRVTICWAIGAMVLATDNVSAFALKAGLNRTTLYRASKQNLGLDLLVKILRAADFKLVVVDHPKIRGKPSLISEHLSSAFNSEEMTLITNAFSKTLRAQGNVVVFAKKVNIHRVSLYHSFTAPCVPKLDTVLSVLNALGLRLAVIPAG